MHFGCTHPEFFGEAAKDFLPSEDRASLITTRMSWGLVTHHSLFANCE